MSRTAWWSLTRGVGLVCLALAALALGLLARRHQQPHPVPQALAAFLDVGSGDCTLIRTIDGTTILLDAGSAETAKNVVHDLHRLHVRTVDLLVLASPEARSIGGVPAVLAAFPVRAVWSTGAEGGSQAWQEALEAVGQHRVPLQTKYAGDHIQIGKATFWAAVWPPAQGARAHRDNLVYQLDFGTTRILFAGASRPEGEAFLVANRGAALGCDDGSCTDLVLQATAGGAEGGTNAELLRQAAPSVVVASCGAGSPPAPGVLHRLGAAGAALWRTDTQGTVLVTTDGRSAPTVTSAHL